jgi:tRNA dimethylallyltransferase
MQAIGYREFFERDADLVAVADAIKRDTRQYAKRQMTFFRKLPGIVWLKPDSAALAAALRPLQAGPTDRRQSRAGPS